MSDMPQGPPSAATRAKHPTDVHAKALAINLAGRNYDLLEKRLASTRGAETRFFAFADTIVARLLSIGDKAMHPATIEELSTSSRVG